MKSTSNFLPLILLAFVVCFSAAKAMQILISGDTSYSQSAAVK